MRAEYAAQLSAAGLDPDWVAELVDRCLTEDLGERGDVTSIATIPAESRGTADVVLRADGVLAGVPVACAVLSALDVDAEIDVRATDGQRVGGGDVVLTVTGRVRQLLTVERTMLNLLCRASGVATVTRAWADALGGTGAQVLDTRKTTPGLRALEKYAVRCGGGTNKRLGLSDVAMVKDNHVVAAGGVVAAYDAVRTRFPDLAVHVEVTDLDQLVAVLRAGCEHVMLDNMDSPTMTEAVRLTAGRATLEATGRMSLDRAREVAATGVDFVSVGALTHSVVVLDLGLDLLP